MAQQNKPAAAIANALGSNVQNVFLAMALPWATRDGNGMGWWDDGMMEVSYPLVNIQKTMERSTIFNGNIHYFDWAIFNSFLYVYQRVSHAPVLNLWGKIRGFLLNKPSSSYGEFSMERHGIFWMMGWWDDMGASDIGESPSHHGWGRWLGYPHVFGNLHIKMIHLGFVE